MRCLTLWSSLNCSLDLRPKRHLYSSFVKFIAASLGVFAAAATFRFVAMLGLFSFYKTNILFVAHCFSEFVKITSLLNIYVFYQQFW